MNTSSEHQTLEPLTYTVKELAVLLGISERAVYRMLRAGRLPVVDLGNDRRVVPKGAFHEWLEASTARPS